MAKVKTGLGRLLRATKGSELDFGLSERRVGLLVNPTSVDEDLRHAVDAGLAAGWNITRLFGPEHGVRGEAQDMESVEQQSDPVTGLPSVSLYGSSLETLRPSSADLDQIDVLVIDLQDIGARYYTYVATAAYCAEVCGELGIDVVVCDRPNPLGGEVVEGNIVLDGNRSFVGAYPLATRHGMTLGELMGYLAANCGVACNLSVVPMLGWERSMFFDETELPWVMPSPNMPTLDTAIVYPGQCLLEGTNLSEARGTTRPFELFGAPWLDAAALKEHLDARELPGCAWREVAFKPMFQKHAGRVCKGLQLHVTDRNTLRSLLTSIALIQDVLTLHEELEWRTEAYEFVNDQLAIDLLFGDTLVRHAVSDGTDIQELNLLFAAAREEFEELRRAALLY